MSGREGPSRRWVSVDGARFDLERGEWAHAWPATAGDGSAVRDGFVSVDGAWFNLARAEWGVPPWLVVANETHVVPEGFVSVDGALLPVEPS
jgi:hypothetical protein